MSVPDLAWLRRGGLVVSCQARPDNPLHGSAHMAAMARAAAEAGAIGIRANGAADIAAIRAAVGLPIIGILKRATPGFAVEITPAFADAAAVVAAGASVVAIDATGRRRDGEPLDALVDMIRTRLRVPVMADVATLAQGLHAATLGCEIVATTLSGYTDDSPRLPGPDFDLVARLAARLAVPIVAEGRIATPEEVARAIAVGARAVVVGTAITNPREIARRFVAAGAGA